MGRSVEVIFRTRALERRYQESKQAVRHWGEAVGKKYISRVTELQYVRDFGALGEIRSMRLHPLKGDRAGKWAINLTGSHRLIVSKGDTEEQIIIEGVSKHYGD